MFVNTVTPELRKAMDEYFKQFDDIVPLEMVPSNETVEGLIKNIRRCLETGKDLLPEIYGWSLDGKIVY